MPVNPFKEPNCAMCRWWRPFGNGKRNFSNRGVCEAVKASMLIENTTRGSDACALFDRLTAIEQGGENG